MRISYCSSDVCSSDLCTLASVAGGCLGYGIGYFLYESVGLWLLGVLGLTDSFPAAACYLRNYGAEIILVKGATPIPFKLLTITAGFIHMNVATFLWASLASRAFSFLLVGILFRLFGAPIKAFKIGRAHVGTPVTNEQH